MDIKETFSKLEPWQKVAIVGGFGVVVYVFFIKKSNSGNDELAEPGIVTATNSGGGSAVGMDSGSMSAGTDQTLSKIIADTQEGFDILKSQNTELTTALETLTNSNDSLQESLDALKSENNTLKNNFNQISNEFESYQTNTNKAITTTNENFNTLKNVSATTAVKDYGNNGVGWTPDNGKVLDNKLKNDSDFRQSEIQRTLSVIENRKSAGLDTSLQQKYLSSIKAI